VGRTGRRLLSFTLEGSVFHCRFELSRSGRANGKPTGNFSVYQVVEKGSREFEHAKVKGV
jgi:hypothetical protein